MDDWSTFPDRNAVSEPAPNPQSPMSRPAPGPLPDSARRLKRPHRRRSPLPATQALDPTGLARQQTYEVQGEAPKPLYPPNDPTITAPQPSHQQHPNGNNLEPPPDTTRPLMDDNRSSISGVEE